MDTKKRKKQDKQKCNTEHKQEKKDKCTHEKGLTIICQSCGKVIQE